METIPIEYVPLKTDFSKLNSSVESRPEYEFTKAFVKSAVNEFQKLDRIGTENGGGGLGMGMQVVAGGASVAAGSTSYFCGGPFGLAPASVTTSILKSLDSIQKVKKKQLVITIVDSYSTKEFSTAFRQLFIDTGVRAYYTYEFQLNKMFLKVGSGPDSDSTNTNTNKPSFNDTKTQQHAMKIQTRQQLALDLLATYAGGVCFKYMVENETKEHLLKALTIPSLAKKIKSELKLKTHERLYYWTTSGAIPKKKNISPYDFFTKAIPVFAQVQQPTTNTPTTTTTNTTTSNVQSSWKFEVFEHHHPALVKSKYIIDTLRRPMDFESSDVSIKLVTLNVNKLPDNFSVYDFTRKENIFLNSVAVQISGNILKDQSYDWNETILEEIKCLIENFKESQVAVQRTESMTREILPIVKNMSQTLSWNKALSLSTTRVRFNVKDPIESFTGRQQYLTDLHLAIQDCKRAGSIMTVLSQTSIITGLGGIGKTETVRMYIHKFGFNYHHIVWIDAENPTTAEDSFRRLAQEKLKIPQISLEGDKYKPRKFRYILDDIYDYLCQPDASLLLVFDNAESLDNSESENPDNKNGIRRFLPSSLPPTSSVQLSILVTSRNTNWNLQKVIQLDLWTESECVSFLLTQLNLNETPENVSAASELAHLFGLFPLAIQSSVAVIRQQSKLKSILKTETETWGLQSYGIKDLINDYQNGDRHVLEKPPLESDSSGSRITMLGIWGVTLKKISQNLSHGELAIKVLNVMAYLSPTNIPNELLANLFDDDAGKAGNLAEALLLLTDYSLISTKSTDRHFTMHRMIQDVTVENLKSRNRAPGQEVKLLIWLTQRFKTYLQSKQKRTQVYMDIIANVVHVTEHLLSKLDVPEFLEFTEYIANEIMVSEFRISISEKYLEKLVAYSEKRHGRSHEMTQRYRLSLASALRSRGRHIKSIQIITEVLAEQEDSERSSMLGIANSCQIRISRRTSASTKHDLAMVLFHQGKYDEALEMYEKVLEIRNEEYGPHHVETLRTKNNIALVHYSKRDFENAFKIYSEVCMVREQVLGPLHPETLKAKHNLALTYYSKRDLGKALKLIWEVLEAQEKELGASHMDTLKTKQNIAILSHEISLGDALLMFSEVMECEEKYLGPNHYRTKKTKSNYETLRIMDEENKRLSEADGVRPGKETDDADGGGPHLNFLTFPPTTMTRRPKSNSSAIRSRLLTRSLTFFC